MPRIDRRPPKSKSRFAARASTVARKNDGPNRPDAPQRLQKAMAAAGVGSRRKCEELIAAGRVEVDKQVVTELGTKVDPQRQEIRVDGMPLKRAQLVYFLVNKPPGVVSTNYDPSGRMRVVDLVPADQRVYTVGRLDRMSEGLMLITNDGELANRLAHPRFGVEKSYHVVVAGEPAREDLDRLVQGVHLSDGIARAKRVTVLPKQGQSSRLEIVLREGKNREIRRILAKTGHKVLRLRRVAINGIKLKNLPLGAYRRLTAEELDELRGATRRRPRAATDVAEPRRSPAVVYKRRARKPKDARQGSPRKGRP